MEPKAKMLENELVARVHYVTMGEPRLRAKKILSQMHSLISHDLV